VNRVDGLRERIGKSALEIEKVAYVLGKRETSMGDSVRAEEGDTGIDEAASERAATKANTEKIPAPTKRKAAENEPGVEKKETAQPTKKKQKTPVPSTSSRVTRSSKAKTG